MCFVRARLSSPDDSKVPLARCSAKHSRNCFCARFVCEHIATGMRRRDSALPACVAAHVITD